MMKRKFPKIIYFLFCFLLIFEQSGFAQISGELNVSGYFNSLRNVLVQDKIRPLHLRYLVYDNLSDNFNFFIDQGNLTFPQNQELKNSTKELLNYFFVGISLPNDSFWVNLRPDAADNIIDSYLAQTDLGKVLLEADLQLKKDTANFTSPQTPEGKDYWKKLYQKANELFGGENITIPTLTRPWIVPGEIIIRETQKNAYVYKATLKVMLEQDYLKESATYNFKDERLKQLNEYASELIRKTIIPKLTQEVNTAKRYAPLRQVYYSLILAQWFKQKFSGKSGLYSQLINQKNLNGLISKEAWSKDTYFQAYQKSFKEGEYNIKEPVSALGGKTVRNYMSGGISIGGESIAEAVRSGGKIAGSFLRPIEALNLNGVFSGKFSAGTSQDPYSGKIEINLENTISASSAIKNQTTPVFLKEKYLRGSIFPKGLSQQEKEEGFELGLRMVPSKEDSRGYQLSRNNYWPIFDTSLVKIDQAFLEILQEPMSEKIVRLAKEKKGQPLYILNWGAGNLRSDVELTDKLKGNKFKIYAFGDIIGKNMSDFAENDVVPIFDMAENLVQDIPFGQKMDVIYSYAGIHSLLNALQVNTNEAAFLEYLNNLTKILSAEGFIVFNTLSEVKFEKLKRLLPELKKTFKEVRLIWSKENKDGYIFLQGLKNKSGSSPFLVEKTEAIASSPVIHVSTGENSLLLKGRNEILEANLGVCLLVVAMDKDGNRFMAHFLPSGHVNQEDFFNSGFAEFYFETHLTKMLKDMPRDNVKVAVISSTKDERLDRLLEMVGKNSQSPYIITLEGIEGFLKERGIGVDQRDDKDCMKTVIFDREGNVKIFYSDSKDVEKERIIQLATVNPASSPVVDAKGGIDLRALPIVSQPQLNTPIGNIPIFRPLVNINLDESWDQIQNMLKVGIIPSSERIKEYLQSCYGKENTDQEINRILVCIADILRLQEERVVDTDPYLKEMLALLESDKSVDDMQFALAKILVSEKELLIMEK